MGQLRRSPLWGNARVRPPFGAVQVNRAHLLAEGLMSLFLFNEGGGPIYNLAPRVGPRPGVLTADATWQPSPAGLAVKFDGTDDLIDCGTHYGAAYVAASAFSAVLGAIEPGFIAAFDIVRQKRSPGFHCWTLDHFGGPWRGTLSTTAADRTVEIDAVTAGAPIWLGAAWSSLAYSGELTGYRRGVQYTGPTDTAAMNGGPTELILGGASFTGAIFYLASWARRLSHAEMQWALDEPYAMLEPVIRRRTFSLAAPPPPSTIAPGARTPLVAVTAR